MTKTRAKAIELYWNIAKERCPFHDEDMTNSFLEGFIDCAEYLLLQNTELKAQIEKMKCCQNCDNWNWKHSKCEKKLKGDCFKQSKWILRR